MIKQLIFILIFLFLASCSKKLSINYTNSNSSETINFQEEWKHLTYLSSDELMGRKITQKGHQEAIDYITNQWTTLGLQVEKQNFELGNSGNFGTNIYSTIKGSTNPEKIIVISAHYDHLGFVKSTDKYKMPLKEANDSIFNGADDNASGVSCLIEIGRYFKIHPPKNTIVFLATDAEEIHLQGSKYFVKTYPELKNVVLNINLDMISRNDQNQINILTYDEVIKTYFQENYENKEVKLTFNHDKNSIKKSDDWTKSSDHYPFHTKKIPFIYFGVEDHPDYHQNSDEFEKIDVKFYERVSNLILNSVIDLDNSIV